jgi:glutamate racemase
VRPDSQPPGARAPIGIFDSGFGGLTVARAVMDQLPNEDVIYLGDTARAPYGEQLIADVREFTLECLDHLVDLGVKALVIACNSGSAATLRDACRPPGGRSPPPATDGSG